MKHAQPQTSTKREAVILPCSCQSASQDDAYGIGWRVHNPLKGDGYRCTVCAKEKASR